MRPAIHIDVGRHHWTIRAYRGQLWQRTESGAKPVPCLWDDAGHWLISDRTPSATLGELFLVCLHAGRGNRVNIWIGQTKYRVRIVAQIPVGDSDPAAVAHVDPSTRVICLALGAGAAQIGECIARLVNLESRRGRHVKAA